MKKSRKHKKILNNYEQVKSNHLERLASKMLKDDKKYQKLKYKNIKRNFLKDF